MNCPTCNIPLTMSDRQGIEIDYCPQCRGIWLDRGELDKIIDRSAAVETRLQGHRDDDDEHHYMTEYGDPRRRRKSFLGDLLDFG